MGALMAIAGLLFTLSAVQTIEHIQYSPFFNRVWQDLVCLIESEETEVVRTLKWPGT